MDQPLHDDADAAPNPSPRRHGSPFEVDALLTSPAGMCLVIGWVDDRQARLQTLGLASQGRTLVATTRIARCRRGDVEAGMPHAGRHLFGFWALLCPPTKICAMGTCTVELQAGTNVHTASVEAQATSNTQLRDTALGYLADAGYFGNPEVEAFLQLGVGPGDELIRFGQAVAAGITEHPQIERFGPARDSYIGSIIVVLFGRPEYLFLQSALFAADAHAAGYEFIYVCNSPELSETLLKEARIAARIYGLSHTLIFLPDNAGFAAANNLATQSARSDRLIFVNPDVLPRATDWAAQHSRLVAALPRDQTTLFGATLFYDDGSLMHAGMYFEIDVGLSQQEARMTRAELIRVEHYGKGAPPDTAELLRARQVPAVSGAFMSIERSWFETLGGFGEDFIFGHYEDADLCLKSLERGRAAWVHPLPTWHLEGKGGARGRAQAGATRLNRWHFSQRWIPSIARDLLGPKPPRFEP